MIEFLCPNGHRIHCPAEQAGRAARCPRCGVRFRIPDPSEVETHKAAGSDSQISRPELTDSAVAHSPPDGRQRTAVDDSQIEFLCPDGHRLHGPASLQGRPGECPLCGSKFRIPTYDDVSEEEETEQDIGVGRAGGAGGPGVALRQVDEIQGIPDQDRYAESADPQRLATAVSAGKGGRIAPGHPLAELFSKLWAEKAQGAAVELHLADGETLLPDRFAEPLSQQKYGVFAVKEPGGTHTLTVVAWESIVRVLVRGVKQLPEEMSD